MDPFTRQKQSALEGVDLSRKGAIDEQIADFVCYINSQEQFFTTSSCSGRICVYEENIDAGRKKQGCTWLLVSHDPVALEQVTAALDSCRSDAFFKFEPFVLHTQCRSLEDARKLHSVAVASGFRNSGISIGRTGKIIVAVRSTHTMEAPLTSKGEILVSQKYLEHLVNLGREKMKENVTRINRFYENFRNLVISYGRDSLPRPDRRQQKRHQKPVEQKQSGAEQSKDGEPVTTEVLPEREEADGEDSPDESTQRSPSSEVELCHMFCADVTDNTYSSMSECLLHQCYGRYIGHTLDK